MPALWMHALIQSGLSRRMSILRTGRFLLQPNQARTSLRDGRSVVLRPWAEAHGYHRMVATRPEVQRLPVATPLVVESPGGPKSPPKLELIMIRNPSRRCLKGLQHDSPGQSVSARPGLEGHRAIEPCRGVTTLAAYCFALSGLSHCVFLRPRADAALCPGLSCFGLSGRVVRWTGREYSHCHRIRAPKKFRHLFLRRSSGALMGHCARGR